MGHIAIGIKLSSTKDPSTQKPNLHKEPQVQRQHPPVWFTGMDGGSTANSPGMGRGMQRHPDTACIPDNSKGLQSSWSLC